MATGAHHTCAVLTSGSANCWGYSNYGQLGTGDTTNRYSPASVAGLGSGAVAKNVVLHNLNGPIHSSKL